MYFYPKNNPQHSNNIGNSLVQVRIKEHRNNRLSVPTPALKEIENSQKLICSEKKGNRKFNDQHGTNSALFCKSPLHVARYNQMQAVDEVLSEENSFGQLTTPVNLSSKKSIGINERTSLNKNQDNNPADQHLNSQLNRLSSSNKKSELRFCQKTCNNSSKENIDPNDGGPYTTSSKKSNGYLHKISQQQRSSTDPYHNSPSFAQRLDELNFVDDSTNLWTWYGYIMYILLLLCSTLLCISMMYRNYRYKLRTSYVLYNFRLNTTLIYLLVTLVSSIF